MRRDFAFTLIHHGHVERKDKEDWVSKCRILNVQGAGTRGRPRKAWKDCVEEDRHKLGLENVETTDRQKWRCGLLGNRLTRASMDKKT